MQKIFLDYCKFHVAKKSLGFVTFNLFNLTPYYFLFTFVANYLCVIL